MSDTAEAYWQSRTRFAERGRDRCQVDLAAERALTDDLAAALTLAVGEKPSTAYDTVKEINRVLARYRATRQ